MRKIDFVKCQNWLSQRPGSPGEDLLPRGGPATPGFPGEDLLHQAPQGRTCCSLPLYNVGGSRAPPSHGTSDSKEGKVTVISDSDLISNFIFNENMLESGAA